MLIFVGLFENMEILGKNAGLYGHLAIGEELSVGTLNGNREFST